METISLQILNVSINVHCANSYIQNLLNANFSALRDREAAHEAMAVLEYSVELNGVNHFAILRAGGPVIANADEYDLIYFLEKDVTVELQKIRKDLLFIHGAALEFEDKACLIVAPSGSGKSTTTWALLHHGFRYLSDELAPIDLSTMKVSAYPHALCLKADPPQPYTLPANVVRTIATIHVPVDSLPAHVCHTPVPLAAIFFVKYNSDLNDPAMHEISAAEASARIYANALNPLAHPEGGLDTVISVARRCKCFNVMSADLKKTADLIKSAMKRI